MAQLFIVAMYPAGTEGRYAGVHLKDTIMGAVNIDGEDSISVKEFEDGNSIQVRVLVSQEEKAEYDKGKNVKVIYQGEEMTGRIVSDPILIDRKRDDGKITLSLIVEKS